jgi:hypothetical protein
VTTGELVAGGPNQEEPLGSFFRKSGNIVAFRLLYLHFAARTEEVP